MCGLQFGYREYELAHMYFGKYLDIYAEWKKLHNIRMERKIFREEEQQKSLMDL